MVEEVAVTLLARAGLTTIARTRTDPLHLLNNRHRAAVVVQVEDITITLHLMMIGVVEADPVGAVGKIFALLHLLHCPHQRLVTETSETSEIKTHNTITRSQDASYFVPLLIYI